MRGKDGSKNMAHDEIEVIGPHACRDCYKINGEFTEDENETRVCGDCGGTVLDLKELVDTLADRDSEIRELRSLHESWEMDEEEDEYDDE